MRLLKLLLVLSGFAFLVSSVEAMPPPPPGKWQCVAVNGRGMHFRQNAYAQNSAMRGAMQRCYAAGSVNCYPGQCYLNSGAVPVAPPVGPMGRPWACTVRDHRGRIWQRTSSADSCVMAMAACNQWHQVRQMTGYRCWVVSKNPV